MYVKDYKYLHFGGKDSIKKVFTGSDVEMGNFVHTLRIDFHLFCYEPQPHPDPLSSVIFLYLWLDQFGYPCTQIPGFNQHRVSHKSFLELIIINQFIFVFIFLIRLIQMHPPPRWQRPCWRVWRAQKTCTVVTSLRSLRFLTTLWRNWRKKLKIWSRRRGLPRQQKSQWYV